MTPEPVASASTPETDAPQPVDRLGGLFVSLLALGAILMSPQFLWAWVDYRRLAAHLDGALSMDAFWGENDLVWRSETLATTLLAIPVFVAATVVLLVWVWRARRNAALLAPTQQFRFSPGSAAGGLLIPVANIWLARPVFEEIWTASRPPDAASDSPRAVRSWWLCLLTGFAVSVLGTLAIPMPVLVYQPGGTLISGGDDALSALLATAVLNSVLLVLAAVSSVLCATIVRKISRWQTDRFPAHLTEPATGHPEQQQPQETVASRPATPPRTPPDPATTRPDQQPPQETVPGRPATPPRAPVAALVYCAVLALGLTALGFLCLVGAVALPEAAQVFVAIGLAILTPAALMWTAIVRLATHPPRGAALLLTTVTTVGLVMIALAGSSVAFGGSGMQEGNVVIIGLVHLGGAALLAAQQFGRSRNGTASMQADEGR